MRSGERALWRLGPRGATTTAVGHGSAFSGRRSACSEPGKVEQARDGQSCPETHPSGEAAEKTALPLGKMILLVPELKIEGY